ncbi:hypothetical protein A0H76_2568 [Hepatospora eriocheir]|uniref:Uncharacterized protein n=1 Tax=Hepatospora eriocheir TaxID=1081669 RepID=A0A1X0QJP5_9MICR|nr:hypothetical protein A0H76_2568 [Hepatospora eriocheir]
MNQPVSLFDFYYHKSLYKFSSLPLPKQLKALSTYKILVIDLCGFYTLCHSLFPESTTVFLADYSDIEELIILVNDYDVIYVILYVDKIINFPFNHIKIIFDKKKIINY